MGTPSEGDLAATAWCSLMAQPLPQRRESGLAGDAAGWFGWTGRWTGNEPLARQSVPSSHPGLRCSAVQ